MRKKRGKIIEGCGSSHPKILSIKKNNEKKYWVISPKNSANQKHSILGDGQFVDEVLEGHRLLNEKKVPRILWEELWENAVKWAGLCLPDLVSGSKSPAVVRGRCVLSYIAVRMMKMKIISVADYLNVS